MDEERTQDIETAKARRPPAPNLRGVFVREGESWIRWHCTLGHEHREKVVVGDPALVALCYLSNSPQTTAAHPMCS